MSWDRVKKIYLDVGKAGGENPLLDGKRAYAGATPTFIQGDRMKLQLWLRSVTAGYDTTTVEVLPAGSVIIVAAKAKATMSTSDLLFYADGFAQDGSEDNIYYEADLDLDIAGIQDALGATANTLDIRVDVEIQDASNSARATMQFDATIYRQVYAGESPPPVLGTPAGGLHKVEGGVWQVKNVDTGAWRTFWLSGDNDQITFGEVG
jgi:hypothetical protein